MKTIKMKTISLVPLLMIFFIIQSSLAQTNQNNIKLQETKMFSKNKISVIQSQYLDKEGFPSHDVFLEKNGLSAKNVNTLSTPYFTVSFKKSDLTDKNGKIKIDKSAELMNLDFCIKNISSYKSTNIAVPIWDGRVYEDSNNLIVGGYSSKYNERPVGEINSKGLVSKQNYPVDSKEFPILQIPTEQILFDPFEWKLIQLKPNSNRTVQKENYSFLPISIYDQKSELLKNIHFIIEKQSGTSSLMLFGIIDGEKIELANCNMKNSEITVQKEGFRPELITGSSQLGKGEIVSLTFKGTYNDNISFDGEQLHLSKNIKNSGTTNNNSKKSTIEIDGNFQDWRNISGISDIKGDYVSYLFKNPDTDLLEFKVTNDDKYLYFYSRVAGAHGRTGEKGRYYWYTYIDVDTNPETGYPPTRDDNCYFGIAIGDDCEAQFEFIGNKFVKTFFGFTGVGAEKEVLSGELKLGPSFYSPKGKDGKKRDRYKMEYVHRDGSRFTTEDYTEGTSEDIIIALSPDGSEVEVKVELVGFLKDTSGKMLVQKGQKIDIAVGVEGSSDHYGSDDWGADSSAVIYGYIIK